MQSCSLLSIGIAVFACLSGLSSAHYKSPYHLVEHYKPKHFFEKFSFYTGGDPTYGFVQYVNHTYAKQNGLINTHKDRVTIGVDNVNYYNPNGPGRPSVRLESHKTYTHGLFVLDLNQMPHACGAWPAFWTYGPEWPNSGEIDIIEGVNTNHYNLMSLHTSKDCTIAGSDQTGELITNACNLGDSHTGCGVMAKDKHNNTFGRGFNRAGGGVYAMEWTSAWIRTWHWPRHKVPRSLKKGYPDTSKFGVPLANFQGSCDIDKHFKDHSIVFDVTFCGGYAGGVYSQSECPNAAQGYRGCLDFVGNNPSHYNNVQWDINHLKVYQLKDGETGYTTLPTGYSSVVPYISTARPEHLSTVIIPGGGNTKHVPSHTLSVASTHKSNNPATRTTSHKSTKTSHSTSKTSHSTSKKTTSKSSHSITSKSVKTSSSARSSSSATESITTTGSSASSHSTLRSEVSSLVSQSDTTLQPQKTTPTSKKSSTTTEKHTSATSKHSSTHGTSTEHSEPHQTASHTTSRKHPIKSFLTKGILHKPTAKTTAKHN